MTKEDTKINLEEYVNRLGGANYRTLRTVYKKWIKNEISLIDPRPPSDFIGYLKRLDYALWFWTIFLFILATVLIIAVSQRLPLLIYARYVLGSIFVLFIPGHVLVESLYPSEEQLTPLERTALSIGLSLSVTSLIGLILNYTYWGLKLSSVLLVLILFTVTLLLVAAYRKYSIIELRRRIDKTRIIVINRKEKG